MIKDKDMSDSLINHANQIARRLLRVRISFYLRMLVAGSLLSLLLWYADLPEVVALLSQISIFWLGVAIVVHTLGIVVWAFRWYSLFQIFDISASFARLVEALYIGTFVGSFMPTTFGGDFYRAHWVLDDKQLYAKSLFVIFMERIIGLAFLGYVSLAGVLLLVHNSGWLTETRLLLLPLGLLCASLLALHPSVFAFFDRSLFSTRVFLRERRQKVYETLQLLHHAGRKKWNVYLAALGVQLTAILYHYCLGRTLGLSLELWHFLIITPITSLVLTLPFHVGGFGGREATLVVLITMLQAPATPAEAVTLGILIGILRLAVSVFGGLLYMFGSQTSANLPQRMEEVLP